jgi:serine protease Do
MNKKYFSPGIFIVGLLVFLVSMGQPGSRAEVIVLKGGAEVNGAILKRGPAVVVVDLGYDVLRIPRTEILEILKERKKTEPPPTRTQKQTSTLYTVKSLEETSTVENVSVFAPAVVVVSSPAGLGSGFFINRLGYLVTNFHVVMGQRHISVTRFKKSGVELKRILYKDVRIVALDPFHDLAVLQVKEIAGEPFTPVVLGTETNPKVGEKIFVIGNPLGLERTVTEGVISHTARNFGGRLYLQVDASVNPGNSGGPLFNSRGQVLGVINMGVRSMQGLNFAIPIHHVKYIMDHIDAFAFNEANPLSGYVYSPPPPNPLKALPPQKPQKSLNKNEKGDKNQ